MALNLLAIINLLRQSGSAAGTIGSLIKEVKALKEKGIINKGHF